MVCPLKNMKLLYGLINIIQCDVKHARKKKWKMKGWVVTDILYQRAMKNNSYLRNYTERNDTCHSSKIILVTTPNIDRTLDTYFGINLSVRNSLCDVLNRLVFIQINLEEFLKSIAVYVKLIFLTKCPSSDQHGVL